MNKILLTIMPKYDDGTEYLAYYASLVEKKAEEKNIEKKSFPDKEACEKNVSKYIEKKDPKLIFINGHGDANSLEGDQGEILFSACIVK